MKFLFFKAIPKFEAIPFKLPKKLNLPPAASIDWEFIFSVN